MRIFIRTKFNTKYLILGNRKFKFFSVSFPHYLSYRNGKDELRISDNNIRSLGIRCSSLEEGRELSCLCEKLGFSNVILGSFEGSEESPKYYYPDRVIPDTIRTRILFTFSFVQDQEHITKFFEFIKKSRELGYKTNYKVVGINGEIIK